MYRHRVFEELIAELLIVELLIGMGYGGTSENAGKAIGKSGDDGVDGVIDQGPLSVDQIYVQPKGTLFTTASFTTPAIQTAADLGIRIVLIDGQRLAQLMISDNIGYEDEEFFER